MARDAVGMHGHWPPRSRVAHQTHRPVYACAIPSLLWSRVRLMATAISSLLIFAVVTIGTLVGLTLFACFGGYQIRGQWLERWGNVFTTLVLIIGALVLSGVI
jgi:hypothetical protein